MIRNFEFVIAYWYHQQSHHAEKRNCNDTKHSILFTLLCTEAQHLLREPDKVVVRQSGGTGHAARGSASSSVRYSPALHQQSFSHHQTTRYRACKLVKPTQCYQLVQSTNWREFISMVLGWHEPKFVIISKSKKPRVILLGKFMLTI